MRLIRVDEVGPDTAGAGVTVAVIDSGVDVDHPDLRGRIEGTVSVVAGAPLASANVHGTAVAGVIVAAADNAVGIRGVAPAATVLAIKACEPVSAGVERADCTSESVARGLDLAVRRGARVINLSLGGPRDPLVAHLVEAAVGRGTVVVHRPRRPVPSLLRHLDGGGPFRGAVALALGERPDLSPEQVRALLVETAPDLGSQGRDDTFEHGLLDAALVAEIGWSRAIPALMRGFRRC